jgi:hypothetical protein
MEPLDRPGQFDSADDDWFSADRIGGRAGARGLQLGLAAIGEMTMGVASKQAIFGRGAKQVFHQALGVRYGQAGTIELPRD